jgi:FMN phosphatase YigB (HAD superfamily)
MRGSTIKNLIFDLGGVILDLSVDHTLHGFSDLSGIEMTKVKQIFTASPEFNSYEKGELSDSDFRDFVRKVYAITASDSNIDTAWNAMLLGIPILKLELLKKLKQKYNVYLLSNTNNIHLQYIQGTMMPGITGEDSLDPYFHKTYYSHRMGKRKPDAEIFEQVLSENQLSPEETLFLDDNASNVAGAELVKIKTVHVTSPDIILDYFNE